MTSIIPNFPIVNSDGTVSEWFREFLNRVDRYLPIEGDGSPEGIVEAPQFALYLDRTGSTGTIEYRKMQPEIGGDRSKGWELV